MQAGTMEVQLLGARCVRQVDEVGESVRLHCIEKHRLTTRSAWARIGLPLSSANDAMPDQPYLPGSPGALRAPQCKVE